MYAVCIHEPHVSRLFITWIKLLHILLSNINIWLPRGKVKKYMPACFKPLYRDVRVIVDCTEIRTERPSYFEGQCATYNSYKACNTHKALVGISPSGVPTFISELYEGSISDNAITNHSKLRELMQPGDAMMADRGWTCASWLEFILLSLHAFNFRNMSVFSTKLAMQNMQYHNIILDVKSFNIKYNKL